MVIPGDKIPDEAGTTTSASSRVRSSSSKSSASQTQTSTTAATTTATGASSSQPAAVSVENESHNKLSSGAIAGIAVGGVVIVLLLGALLFLLGRHTTMLQFMKRQQLSAPMAYPVGSPIPYHDPNTPMTHNSYTGPYAYQKYASRGNPVELGNDRTSIQPPHSPGQSIYSGQFGEYGRQKVTGSPPPTPMGTHIDSPR